MDGRASRIPSGQRPVGMSRGPSGALKWYPQPNSLPPISISRRFSKAEELKKRIWFTLGALIVYRLGTYIPLPGIDPTAFAHVLQRQAQGILGMFNMFAGGAVQRMAIFALNIMPYISASIIIQLMTIGRRRRSKR